ncbi:hypothetical protein L2E82_31526 [Cichorium intybus]|uniref:Uncharacterized protein n=1 Tax=Cichorium intybus TaxID=13427 RepID=A0ACB9BDD7_CICIN|nr:hypothetical protein L2E82_31526 [Cichorium intybus]
MWDNGYAITFVFVCSVKPSNFSCSYTASFSHLLFYFSMFAVSLTSFLIIQGLAFRKTVKYESVVIVLGKLEPL